MSRKFNTFLQLFCRVKTGCNNAGALHRFYSQQPKKLQIGVLGAGFSKGQPKPGVENGPEIIRGSGFMDALRTEIGHDVLDYGNISFYPSSKSESSKKSSKLKNLEEVAQANFKISEMTAKIIGEGRIPLTLGGDHSIAIGSVHGVSSVVKEDMGILWVDAHTDINTEETTWSGNIHGMSMSFLLKELKHAQKIPEFSWVTPRISAANIAYIGLRSVDSAEREILDKLGILAFSMRDVDRMGIVEVTKRALDKITQGGKRPLHVSFDIDALDDKEIGRNTGTPVLGGLTVREGLTLLEEVHESGKVVSMDLVEVNPSLGDKACLERTAEVSKYLLVSAFGGNRGGQGPLK